ncbi:hypothetical protein D9C73_021870 [Collichthys lucidus]|uniref:Uncharacterized protein n=1 Tax=Collichthys lucidus TaxID=240159 RepID=A0A4U5VHX1_COLLU|nr:hypothetical protein D9C73_021870 [Collichthys lucidus]
MEATPRIINTIRGTAAITKIRSRIETERGLTGTKTTETGDMGGMVRTETKTDFMSKDLCPQEEHCFFYKGHSFSREQGRWTLLKLLSDQLTELLAGSKT